MNKGFLLGLLAAACWGAVYIAYHFTLDKVSPLRIMIYGGLLDLLILVPLLLWRGEKLFDESLSNPKVLTVVTIAMLIALVANFLILYSIKILGANTAAILEISYPVFTCLGLYFFFDKQMDSQFLMGAGLIFLGVCLVVTRPDVEEKNTRKLAKVSQESSRFQVVEDSFVPEPISMVMPEVSLAPLEHDPRM